MRGAEEIAEKAIMLGKRHTSSCRVGWMMRLTAPASHPLCQLPKPQADHFIPKTHGFIRKTRYPDSMDNQNIKYKLDSPPPASRYPVMKKSILKVANVVNKYVEYFQVFP